MRVRKVARLVGQIISMSMVIGSVSQLMTRSLSMDIVSASSWNSYVTLSPMSIRQLSFWEENLSAFNVNHFDVSYGCHKIV